MTSFADIFERPTIEYMVSVVQGWLEEANQENRDAFLATHFDSLGAYHHGLGTRIRNHFCLWMFPWQPELDERQVDCSPDHPDQYSFRVIEEVWKSADAEVIE